MVRTLEAADGRRLEVFVDGPEDGIPLIGHHGTPSSGMQYPPHVAERTKRGLRSVGWSRPGYGGSDRLEGRVVADCVQDVVAIADALGADRFYTDGGSGGGPHALATAALLPDRVIACACIAGIVPWGAEGIDWLEGMGDENVTEFNLALEGGERLVQFLEGHRESLLSATPEASIESMQTLLSEVDLRVMTGELGEFFAKESAHALEPGVGGWYDDDIAFTKPWGFDLDAIRVPVAIWQGAEDRFVPLTHGEWLAASVPGASAHLLPGEGHLSLGEARYGDILDELLAAGG